MLIHRIVPGQIVSVAAAGHPNATGMPPNRGWG
jgi:hypothetical protein